MRQLAQNPPLRLHTLMKLTPVQRSPAQLLLPPFQPITNLTPALPLRPHLRMPLALETVILIPALLLRVRVPALRQSPKPRVLLLMTVPPV